MTNIKALDGLATMIQANGGAAFCRGYIDASTGQGFTMPNLIGHPEYAVGFLSVADRSDLDFIASVALPNLDFTGCDDAAVKDELVKLID